MYLVETLEKGRICQLKKWNRASEPSFGKLLAKERFFPILLLPPRFTSEVWIQNALESAGNRKAHPFLARR